MTRQAVMRHRRVLEPAGLVTTENVGRERRHDLGPVPSRFVYDRWVDRYARPLARYLTRLTYDLHVGGDPADLNASRVTYTKARAGDVCQLRLVHDRMDERDTAEGYAGGRARILSGLKTWLETGRPLVRA